MPSAHAAPGAPQGQARHRHGAPVRQRPQQHPGLLEISTAAGEGARAAVPSRAGWCRVWGDKAGPTPSCGAGWDPAMQQHVEAARVGRQHQAAGARTSRTPGMPRAPSTFSEAPGVVVVSAQRLIRLLQPDAGSGCQHARLPQPPAQQLPRAPGLGDKPAASSQHRAGRGAQALRSPRSGDPSCPRPSWGRAQGWPSPQGPDAPEQGQGPSFSGPI